MMSLWLAMCKRWAWLMSHDTMCKDIRGQPLGLPVSQEGSKNASHMLCRPPPPMASIPLRLI